MQGGIPGHTAAPVMADEREFIIAQGRGDTGHIGGQRAIIVIRDVGGDTHCRHSRVGRARRRDSPQPRAGQSGAATDTSIAASREVESPAVHRFHNGPQPGRRCLGHFKITIDHRFPFVRGVRARHSGQAGRVLDFPAQFRAAQTFSVLARGPRHIVGRWTRGLPPVAAVACNSLGA